MPSWKIGEGAPSVQMGLLELIFVTNRSRTEAVDGE